MHAKFFSLAALAAVAFAGPGGTGSNPCNVGSLQCCNQLGRTSDPRVQDLIGLFGANVGGFEGLVGVDCKPLSVTGNSCTAQLACCTGDNFNGHLVLDCVPV